MMEGGNRGLVLQAAVERARPWFAFIRDEPHSIANEELPVAEDQVADALQGHEL
jgi:hypothetical protein